MKIGKLSIATVALASFGLLTGFGLGDLEKQVAPNTDDCAKASDPGKCKKDAQLKTAAKLVIIGVAAKMIHDMVIGANTTQTSAEDQVVSDYKKKNRTLPPDPQVIEYKSSIKPGEVVSAGKEVMVASTLVVVPGEKSKTIDIKEKIEIYDNDKKNEMIKSFEQTVNGKTKKSGAFTNEFKFTLPVGMPQGVYPIKTVVLVDGKAFKPNDTKMQIVLNVDKNNQYRFIALNN